LCYSVDKTTVGSIVDTNVVSPTGISSAPSPLCGVSLHLGVECALPVQVVRFVLLVSFVQKLTFPNRISDDPGSTVVLVSCVDGTIAMWCYYPHGCFSALQDTPPAVVVKAATPAVSLTLDYITSQKRAYRVLAGLWFNLAGGWLVGLPHCWDLRLQVLKTGVCVRGKRTREDLRF
jgi:hypothetical protein